MKKVTTFIFVLLSFLVTSCASVQVSTDFDSQASFSQIRTFAFLKEGIDKVEISDLDKKRILRAIESEFAKKGITLSDTNPDILVNFFTKEQQRQNIYNNIGIGYGWGPIWFNTGTGAVNQQTEGILFIDVLDAQKKDLIWQGKGSGLLSNTKKEERINQFVAEIMKQYPPKAKK